MREGYHQSLNYSVQLRDLMSLATSHWACLFNAHCTLLDSCRVILNTRVKNNFRRKYAHEQYLQLVSQTFKILKYETKQKLVKWTKK